MSSSSISCQNVSEPILCDSEILDIMDNAYISTKTGLPNVHIPNIFIPEKCSTAIGQNGLALPSFWEKPNPVEHVCYTFVDNHFIDFPSNELSTGEALLHQSRDSKIVKLRL